VNVPWNFATTKQKSQKWHKSFLKMRNASTRKWKKFLEMCAGHYSSDVSEITSKSYIFVNYIYFLKFK
jgi:hypothetical protein